MFKILLIVSLVCNLLTISVAIKFISYRGGVKYLTMLFANFRKHKRIISGTSATVARVESFKKYAPTDEDIVFLGDSITQLGEWGELFVGKSVRNRGVGGDKTYNILDRLQPIVDANPHKVFLLVGINDLITGVSEEDIITNYEVIIKRFLEISPRTTLYVESVLPINKELTDTVYATNYKSVVTISNVDIERLNNEIRNLCEKYNVTYIDVYSQVVDHDGQMPSQYTVDGVHLYQDGYLAVAEVLKEYVLYEEFTAV